MSHSERYIEDLPRIAAEAYELAGRLCDGCRIHHAFWAFMRPSRASPGAGKQGSEMGIQIREIFVGGVRDVLLAGAQDTGLMTLAARAGAGLDPNIVVLDICETPLELCRRLAKSWGLPIETIRRDLFELDIEQRFDLVLIHGTLNFIAADRHAQVLRRILRAMRPGGRLVLLFNTSRPPAADQAVEGHAAYADFILNELDRLGIALADREPGMRELLIGRAHLRELRDAKFSRPEEVESLVKAAGFNVLSCVSTSTALAKPADAVLAQFSKRRFMLIAEPSP